MRSADRADAAAGRPPIGRGPAPFTPPGVLPLAQGELSERDAAELAVLKQQIQGAVDFRCDGYKEKCLRRRIAVRMRARGVHDYAGYSRLLRSDPAEYERLVDTLTINVSKFFRNPDVWSTIGERVLPELFARPDERLDAWSAGTASGEEAYSVAMLAREHAAANGHDPRRLRVLGTDIDRGSLVVAERGVYTDFAMTDIDPAVRERWFASDGSYRLRAEARVGVRFARLDLMRDAFPERQHLILCRNVIIYFERSVQEELFRRFHEALVPGGFLVLGKVEALFGAASGLFQAVANRQRVFRRP
jgi:chemotaxis protein methyltransferase CheR